MAVLEKYFRDDVVNWLLEENNPSVRYLTLVNLLDRNNSDREVMLAKAAIMESGVVPKILDQQVGGSWNNPGRYYVDKYKGTVWQLITLAEHEADGGHEKIKDACEYIIHCSQDPDSYGFAVHQRGRSPGGRHNEVIPCLTGNMVWSLLKLGYAEDERLRKGIDWIIQFQRFDDGTDEPPAGWPYDRSEVCWGRHSCHMGVVKALKALSAVPVEQRTAKVQRKIDEACEYLLAHHIYRKSHDLTKVSKPGWLKLQFPLMYQTDILEIVSILTELGIRDDRMQETLQIICSKQTQDGTWTLESTFNGKFRVDIEEKGRPSKWITYRALNVIKKYYNSPDVD